MEWTCVLCIGIRDWSGSGLTNILHPTLQKYLQRLQRSIFSSHSSSSRERVTAFGILMLTTRVKNSQEEKSSVIRDYQLLYLVSFFVFNF